MTVTSPQTTPSPAVPQLPEELVASATFLLKKLGFAAKEGTMKAYEGTGLHPYHHAILLVLDEWSRETQGAIADALGYDRGQLVGLLDTLEEHGLVERRRDPNDRRRHVVTLTPAGRRQLARFRTIVKRIEDEILAPPCTICSCGSQATAIHASCWASRQRPATCFQAGCSRRVRLAAPISRA